MAKQIYIDENGNPIEVSGTINTAELLPISGNDPTDTKTYIDTKTALNNIIKVTAVSGTTSGGGVLSRTFAHNIVVLSAWSSIDNCIVDIYKDGVDFDNTGSLTWNFYCHNATGQSWGNTNLTIRMAYIDYNE